MLIREETYLQKTQNSVTASSAETSGQTRTQPRTLKKDQAEVEGEVRFPLMNRMIDTAID